MPNNKRARDNPTSPDQTQQSSPSSFKGEFSFVNKDANNIDSNDHNAAVSWHVMNRYERWKKQEQARKLRASVKIPGGPKSPSLQSPLSSPPSTSAWSTLPSPQLGAPALGIGQPSTGSVPTATSTPSTQSSGYEDPISILGMPFGTVNDTNVNMGEDEGVATTPLVNRLIAFAYEYVIPQAWPNDSRKLNSAYEIGQSREDVAAITSDSCFGNAFLSLLVQAMAITEDDESLLYHSSYFQNQAIIELRQRVAGGGPQHVLTLKAILKLFCSETLIDNASVARMHLKMLRDFVNADGGILRLDSWFREDLLSCDCYFALKCDTRPLFPAKEWSPGSLPQSWQARIISAAVSDNLDYGIDPVIDHPVLRSVFRDVRELLKTDEYILEHDVPSDDPLRRWCQLRKLDCLSRLADHFVNLTLYPHLFSKPHTQGLICKTATLLINMIDGSPEPVRFGLKLVGDVRQKLEEIEAEEEEATYLNSQRLRLWAFYVGSLAEKVHPTTVGGERASDATEKWFATQLAHTSSVLDLKDWEATKKVLLSFLFSQRLHGEVEEGHSPPPHRTVDVLKGLYAASGQSWREPTTTGQRGSISEDVLEGKGKKRDD